MSIRFLSVLIVVFAGAAAQAGAAPPADLPVKAWALHDALSGRVLAEHRAGEPLAPASLAKLMTALVVLDAVSGGELRLDEPVRIGEQAWRAGGSRMFVRLGEEVSVERLVEGLAVVSANDAAIALAEHVGGSVEAFVARMNATAADIGLESTHFTNPTGFDDPGQHSTATDLTRLARVLVRRYPQYAGWYARKTFAYNTIEQYSRNALLWRDPSADGIKTGHTLNAGYCLIGSASRDGMRLIATVMGAADETARTGAAEQLLQYGFDAFETHRVLGPERPAGHAVVRGGTAQSVAVGVAENVYVTVPRGDGPRIELMVELPAELAAPVEAGQDAGRAVVLIDGRSEREVALHTLERVPAGGVWSRIIEWFR